RRDGARSGGGGRDLEPGPRIVLPRGPRPAEPERRQEVQRRRVRPAVDGADLDEDLAGRRLGILDDDVEVAVGVEDARVDQLVLQLVPAAGMIGLTRSSYG